MNDHNKKVFDRVIKESNLEDAPLDVLTEFQKYINTLIESTNHKQTIGFHGSPKQVSIVDRLQKHEERERIKMENEIIGK